MQNFKLTIQYDGTNYHGWQTQPNTRTVQAELTTVLTLLDHRPVTIHGAGRTDAGVHAEGQVASVLIERNFDPVDLRDAINGNLDRDIRVLKAELTSEDLGRPPDSIAIGHATIANSANLAPREWYRLSPTGAIVMNAAMQINDLQPHLWKILLNKHSRCRRQFDRRGKSVVD